MAHSNTVAFCFVDQAGGKLDKTTRHAVRSHAAKETRRRRRLQQKRHEGLDEASKDGVKLECSAASTENSSLESAQSASKCQKSNMISWRSLPDITVGSGHRNVGEMETSDEPSSRQMVLPICSSPLLNVTSVVFDPFASMAELSPSLSSAYAKDIDVIKSHAIEFCFPGNTKTVVFAEALRTPALLGSILYMAYANLSSLRGWSNPYLGLALKTAAISHVNKKLSHPSTATCTNAIASIAYLSTGIWMFGEEPHEAAAHMTGIQLMVRQRGMKSLGVYLFGQTIQKYLFIQHTIIQAMSAQPSDETFHFDYDLGNGVLKSTTSVSETNPSFLYSTFMDLCNPKIPNQQTASVLQSTKSLVDLLLTHYEDREPNFPDEAEFTLRFNSLKSEIYSCLSACDHTASSYGDFTYESVRLTGILIVEAIETCKPLNQTSQLLASTLIGALERTDLANTWGNMLGVLYWVSMIGSAAWRGRGGPGERLMDSTLGRTMLKMTFENPDVECAIRPARLFGSLQIALKTRCEDIVCRSSSKN